MKPSGIDANESIAHASSGPLSLKHLQRYGLAILSVGVALGVSLLLEHFHFRVPSALLLLFAVAISSWFGGPGPAVFAVVLSTISFYWYFMEPVRTIYIYWSQLPYFVIFAAFAALLSWFGTVRRHIEKDLREQADILNLTHDTIFVMDVAGVIKYWNRGAAERYGWTMEQAVGRVVHDLLMTVFPVSLEQIKAEVMRAGRWEGELVHTRKDGTQVAVASRWALQRDKSGMPVAILETNNDITERKRAQEALRRLNREIMPLYRVSSLSPGRIALGYTVIAILWIAFSDAVVTRLNLPPAVMTIKGTVFVFVTASLLYFTIRRLVQFVQLTSQERDETARLYRTVVEASNEGICLLDESGRISFLNGRLATMLGRPAEELQGKRLQDFIEEPHVLAQRGAQQSNTHECRLRTDSDRKPWVLISRHPVLNDAGEAVQWVGTVIDITERKHAEEALRRSNRELRAISNCNQVLLRATDEQSLLKEICRIVCEEAGYRVAWVGYAEHDEAKSVRPAAWTGTEEEHLTSLGITWADTERGRSPSGTAIRTGKTCCIQDFTTDPRGAPWRESALQHGFRSGIAVPLKDQHANAFGSLAVYNGQPNAFTSDEIRLLEELAGDLAFGIVTLRSRAVREQAEQEVAMLSFALDKGHEAAFLMDGPRFCYVNEEACRRLGYTRAELLGMGVSDIDLDFPAERWSDHWRDLKAQRSMTFESRHRTRDGRIFPVEISANYFEYGGGAYNLAIVRDIAERKRAEEEVRNTAAQWQATFDAVQDLVLLLDKDFRILRANRAAAEFLGLPFDKIVGGHCFNLIHGTSMPPAECPLARMRQSRRHEEVEVLARKGGPWLSVSVDPVFDQNGELTHAVHVARDITERKRAEDAMRRSEAYLAEGQRLAHMGSWAWSPATRQSLYWSEEMIRIFGLNLQDGVPTAETFWQRIHPDDLDRTRELLLKAADGNMEYEHDHRIVLPDGAVKHIHAVGHPVLDQNGKVAEYVGTAIDVTERKETETVLQETRAELERVSRVTTMGALTASIAHEVNQPLAGVVTSANAGLNWLGHSPPNLSKTREALERVLRDGTRAGEVLARIRGLLKRTPSAKTLVSVNQIVREVLALAAGELRGDNIETVLALEPSLPAVLGDTIQLQQVLLNLITNAIEAMTEIAKGQRTLRIQSNSGELDGKPAVMVAVSDTGIGFGSADVTRLFESFHTTKPQGMGVGLWISRSIVEAHGGRLTAQPNSGQGATFVVTIPAVQELAK